MKNFVEPTWYFSGAHHSLKSILLLFLFYWSTDSVRKEVLIVKMDFKQLFGLFFFKKKVTYLGIFKFELVDLESLLSAAIYYGELLTFNSREVGLVLFPFTRVSYGYMLFTSVKSILIYISVSECKKGSTWVIHLLIMCIFLYISL